MTAALWLLGQMLAAVLGARAATCPPDFWLDGVRPSGRFDCLSDHGDDAAAFDALPGRVWCAPGELGVVIDSRRAGCARFTTDT